MFLQFLFFIALSVGGSRAAFFPDDISTVKWAHAVNSKAKLETALKSDALMLEADVSLNSSNVPIMAHPPETSSDLSLEEFLNSVLGASPKKGVKLDFKSTPAFNYSIDVLSKFIASYQNQSIPVWLNADILPGPGGKKPDMDAKEFLKKAKTLNCTLSLGWTTEWTGFQNYTSDNVKDMNKSLSDSAISHPVTFAVRAAVVAKTDVDTIKSLVALNNSSLTVWSSMNDTNITFNALRKVIDEIGRKHVFIDLPSDQMKALNSGTKAILSSACVMLAVGAYAIRFW